MCPICREPMLAVELDGIEVDHCLNCLGTWLDRGEIEAIAMRAGIESWKDILTFADVKATSDPKRRCPRCRRKLDPRTLTDADQLELDRCPLGHGVWFDQGEMLKLVSSKSPGGMEAAAAFFGELFRSELESNPKKGA